jgi:aconitate decarboxylase
LGTRWETDSITLKSYPAMGGVHAPLDGILQLLAEKPIAASDVAHVDIDVSHAIYHHGFWKLERPITTVAAQMNIGYAVAAAILDGRAMVRQFSPDRIDRDDVWVLIPKIRVRHNEEYDKGGRATRFNMRMAVTMTDGSVREVFLPTPKIVSDPLDRAATIAKFKVITDGIIGGNRQDAIIETALGLDDLPDLGGLTGLLAPVVNPAFA